MVQLHQLKSRNRKKKSKKVGRGGKRGKTSGRGTKGQKARAGGKLRPEMRDIIKRLPKLRGYRFKSFKEKTIVINLKEIESSFAQNDTVNPETLHEKGLITKGELRRKIKILAEGELSKKIKITGCQVSLKVKEKVESQGGQVAV